MEVVNSKRKIIKGNMDAIYPTTLFHGYPSSNDKELALRKRAWRKKEDQRQRKIRHIKKTSSPIRTPVQKQ